LKRLLAASPLQFNLILSNYPEFSLGLSLVDLAGFLSTELVKGGIIDSIMDLIMEHVDDTPHLQGKVLVQDLTAGEYLRFDNRWSQYDYMPFFWHL
jgi:hypothetical protein